MEFKRRLYCSENNIPAVAVDLGDPVLRRRLEQCFDDDPSYPSQGAADEYAVLFERTYPDEEDRRRYLDRAMVEATPSYGHLVLAALFRLGKASVVWTTNFDQLIETATSRLFGTTAKLTVADLERHELAQRALAESRFPLLVKLHGDFHSARLKNTTAELQQQDAKLRQALLEGSRRFGLAVVGYSGRDDSVMDTLAEALAAPAPFPHGLFWFVRHGEAPPQRVTDLLDRAGAAGVKATLIEIEAFDELFGRLEGLFDFPADVRAVMEKARPPSRLIPSPVPGAGRRRFPAIRLNALPLLEVPRSARLVTCNVANTAAAREAVKAAGVQVVAAGRADGVIAFGHDADIRKAFKPFGIAGMSLASVAPDPLSSADSTDLGLCYDALATALGRERPLVALKRNRRRHLLAVPSNKSQGPALAPLRRALGRLTGQVPDTPLAWSEAVKLRLEYRFGRCWLLIEPVVWVWRDGDPVRRFDQERKAFIREHHVGRYNREWNTLLQAWVDVLTGGAHTAELHTFGLAAETGIDACFCLANQTAYCWSQTGAPTGSQT
ncbi:MAG TPA: SIR2 family protein [Actinomycetes bacterium]|nr:SIR2 family protein [Actinomycetes bacterium]